MAESANAEPFRVALCITELDPGGAEQQLVSLALGIDRKRFEPRVFCLAARPNSPRLVAQLEQAGIGVAFCEARGLASAPGTLSRLKQMFRQWRPDIVQTFLWHANVLGPLAAKSAGVSHVVTGLRVAEPGRWWRRPLERWAARRADRHVAVSEGVARFAREKIGLAAEKIRVIPNGIATDRYPAESIAAPTDLEKLGVERGRGVLLFVGRFDKQKGIDELVAHAPDLLACLPRHELLLVGDGLRRAEIELRIRSQKQSDRIRILGQREDVPVLMAAASLLLAPSRWEGMSNVVLEAMASGLPVVGFDVEGMRELLGEPGREQLVPPGHWPQFIERAVAFASDEAARKTIAALLRARAKNEFDLSFTIARYEQLFLELSRR